MVKHVSFQDLSPEKQVAELRRWVKSIREGGEYAAMLEPEYHEDIAARFDDLADRIEAGEDPFAEEEESPEELQAQADTARKVLELLKQENVNSLREFFQRHNIMFEEDLN
jgi:hypothetical protein